MDFGTASASITSVWPASGAGGRPSGTGARPGFAETTCGSVGVAGGIVGDHLVVALQKGCCKENKTHSSGNKFDRNIRIVKDVVNGVSKNVLALRAWNRDDPNTCKGDKKVFPCHYSCDTTQGSGAQWKVVTDDSERNITQSITWVAPASASGTLPNGTEVLFMVGGGTEQKPCSPFNPDPKVCKGFKPLVAFNPDPNVGVVELSSRGAPELALATAAFVGQVLYRAEASSIQILKTGKKFIFFIYTFCCMFV